MPPLEERKDQRDLQDTAQRLLVNCSETAGASLEQTTWLRRNLAVKPGPQIDIMDQDDNATDQEGLWIFNDVQISLLSLSLVPYQLIWGLRLNI